MSFGKTAKDAYIEACRDVEEYSGNDGYNGTISTTSDFCLKTDAPKYGTKAFDKWEAAWLDSAEKRDCVAVEVKGTAAKNFKERNGYKGKHGNVYCFIGWAAE